MNSAGVSSGEEIWSGFSESEAGHHVEDSFDDIGFTDISPDDNPGSCEQNKCELDSDCESDSELEHDVAGKNQLQKEIMSTLNRQLSQF